MYWVAIVSCKLRAAQRKPAVSFYRYFISIICIGSNSTWSRYRVKIAKNINIAYATPTKFIVSPVELWNRYLPWQLLLACVWFLSLNQFIQILILSQFYVQFSKYLHRIFWILSGCFFHTFPHILIRCTKNSYIWVFSWTKVFFTKLIMSKLSPSLNLVIPSGNKKICIASLGFLNFWIEVKHLHHLRKSWSNELMKK